MYTGQFAAFYHTLNCCSHMLFDTDVKLDNVFINYSSETTRFSKITLRD